MIVLHGPCDPDPPGAAVLEDADRGDVSGLVVGLLVTLKADALPQGKFLMNLRSIIFTRDDASP